MTSPLEDPDFVSKSSLAELRKLSNDTIRSLQPECKLWDAESGAAAKRGEKNKIKVLLDEFRSQLRAPGEELQYENAFRPGWYKECEHLYHCRWWINELTAGVYFIYNSDNALEYVGSSCGGTMGDRIHLKRHREYCHTVDVVLLDHHWPHFALAFEALAISRLKPPRNDNDRGFKRMWIDPLPPYDRFWPKPKPKS